MSTELNRGTTGNKSSWQSKRGLPVTSPALHRLGPRSPPKVTLDATGMHSRKNVLAWKDKSRASNTHAYSILFLYCLLVAIDLRCIVKRVFEFFFLSVDRTIILTTKDSFLSLLTSCYTGRFPKTIFSVTQRCNFVATLLRIVTTLLQHSNAVLRWKSSLRVVSYNITLRGRLLWSLCSGLFAFW